MKLISSSAWWTSCIPSFGASWCEAYQTVWKPIKIPWNSSRRTIQAWILSLLISLLSDIEIYWTIAILNNIASVNSVNIITKYCHWLDVIEFVEEKNADNFFTFVVSFCVSALLNGYFCKSWIFLVEKIGDLEKYYKTVLFRTSHCSYQCFFYTNVKRVEYCLLNSSIVNRRNVIFMLEMLLILLTMISGRNVSLN